ncbi:hypothetical protein E4J66_10595 [Actinomyces viscosus]|uniref:Uncharacterized protein n=2 Tax=Actinomyces viscosus TaxID=1656 RepID=A0A448PNQ5_ACTVI|nr:hypothetical protein E4J66_10595 [Actinomyces viscosus]VEI17965.1 Uncharacterised protein [Actinomyces viscosus]
MSPMNTVDAELLAAVRGCYGAVRMRDLELTRTQRRHVASLVRAGELIAHEHGVVGIPGAERAVVLARIHGGLLTCQAAMRYYGLPVARRVEQVHLVVPPGGRLATAGREVLHVDRSQDPPALHGFPVQPLPAALARFLRCHVQDDSPLIALDAALHDERVTTEQVRDLLRGPGSARALTRLDRASDRARSPLETLARMDLEAAGLSFEDGVEIEGIGEVDLVIEEWVVVELDGYTYHCDEYQFGLDRWRDRRLVARGFLPLRFTRQDVYAHQVVPDVQRALERWGVSKSVTKTVAGVECV